MVDSNSPRPASSHDSAPIEATVKHILTHDPSCAPSRPAPFPSIPPTSASHSRRSSRAIPPPVNTSRMELPRRGKSASISSVVIQPQQPPSHHRQAASISHTAAPIRPISHTAAPIRPISALAAPTSPDSTFLTTLAAQERRVLELREELHKAEQQLLNLKKQWASQEATKRRADSRSVHPLRPLTATFPRTSPIGNDEGRSSNWMQEEMERRKALLNISSRTPQRRVFSGSRQTRTLSLVNIHKRLSAPTDNRQPEDEPTRLSDAAGDVDRIKRPSARPNMASPISEEASERSVRVHDSSSPPSTSHEHSKSTQIASDIRAGLWTFFEDLRQATVGDDARPGQTGPPRPDDRAANTGAGHRKPAQPKRPRNPRRHTADLLAYDDDTTLVDIGGAFWKDHGVEFVPSSRAAESQRESRHQTPKTGQRTSGASRSSKRGSKEDRRTPQKPVNLHTRFFEGEAWETWDSPSSAANATPRASEATLESQLSPATLRSSGSSVTSLAAMDTGNSPVINVPSSRTSSQSSVDGAVPRREETTFTSSHRSMLSSPTLGSFPNVSRKRDSIQWPAIPAISKRASQLRSSASQLMDEWEKSLNPPAPSPLSSPDAGSKHRRVAQEDLGPVIF